MDYDGIESITYEKAETLILDKIDQAKGCYARSLIIREMGIPIGICEDILNVIVITNVDCRKWRRIRRLCAIMQVGMFSISETIL